MNRRIAKKVVKRANAGAKYRQSTHRKAFHLVMKRFRRYYPLAYRNWYYSQMLTRQMKELRDQVDTLKGMPEWQFSVVVADEHTERTAQADL